MNPKFFYFTNETYNFIFNSRSYLQRRWRVSRRNFQPSSIKNRGFFQTCESTVQVERQSQPLGDIVPCKLYVQTANGGIEVADGWIYLGASTVHGESLPINHLRVSIDKVYDGCHEIPVPYPAKEGTCLAELIETHLIWPEELIDNAV
jgi:hypothetical protein